MFGTSLTVAISGSTPCGHYICACVCVINYASLLDGHQLQVTDTYIYTQL